MTKGSGDGANKWVLYFKGVRQHNTHNPNLKYTTTTVVPLWSQPGAIGPGACNFYKIWRPSLIAFGFITGGLVLRRGQLPRTDENFDRFGEALQQAHKHS